MKRRQFLIQLLGLAATPVLLACQPQATVSHSDSVPAASPTTSPSAQTSGSQLAGLRRKAPKIDQLVYPPVRMRIPAINIDTQVKEVGLDKNGNMVVPTNGDYAVWLGASAPPGVVGNAVFAGHLDWAGKLGVFYHIKDLSKGDVVEITATDGTKRQFAVTGRQLYDRIKAPLDEIYGPTASASITLITCGGTFLKDVHDYSHRLVVRAELRQS